MYLEFNFKKRSYAFKHITSKQTFITAMTNISFTICK